MLNAILQPQLPHLSLKPSGLSRRRPARSVPSVGARFASGRSSECVACITLRTGAAAHCHRRPCRRYCRRHPLSLPLHPPLPRVATPRSLPTLFPWPLPCSLPSTTTTSIMPSQPVSLVVGAGPAGILSAVYLAQRGHEVHLFDKRPSPLVQDAFRQLSWLVLHTGGSGARAEHNLGL